MRFGCATGAVVLGLRWRERLVRVYMGVEGWVRVAGGG